VTWHSKKKVIPKITMDECKEIKKKTRQRNGYSRADVNVSVRGREGAKLLMKWAIARYTRGTGWAMRVLLTMVFVLLRGPINFRIFV